MNESPMTREYALTMRAYKHYCNCGGYAGLSERSKSRHPHMDWCPQREEWEERQALIEAQP